MRAENRVSNLNFPWKLFWRIVSIQALLILLALGTSALIARVFFKQRFLTQAETQIQDSLTSLSVDLSRGSLSQWCSLHAKDTGFRLTLFSKTGQVLCDSHKNSEPIENHASQREVLTAFKEGYGQSIRHSDSLGVEMLYGALLSPDGEFVLRQAIPLSRLKHTLRVFDLSLGAFLVAIACVLIFFSMWFGRKLLFPMGKLILKASGQTSENLPDEAFATDQPGEWTELESTFDRIQADLKLKTDALSQEREELKTLMSALSDAILAVDQNGNPLFFNSRFMLLFGGVDFSRNRLKLGEIFRAPEILDSFQLALSQGLVKEVQASLHTLNNPLPHYYSIAVAPLRKTEAGPIYGAIGIFHDVTDLKRAEKIRIEFVANVSHELRTPLTAIKGYADTLREDLRQGKLDLAEKFTDIINRNVDRLKHLVEDLLDLSSLESEDSNRQLSKTSMDVKELTSRVLSQLESRWKAKSQTIRTLFEAPTVKGDPARVEQVLVNLLENAIKYTPLQGTIDVQWQSIREGVELHVIDNGPGIPLEHQSRLFERFYRVDQARSRELGGTGLGLSIVKHIMQAHGGSATVLSDMEKGSDFICHFPN